MFKICFAILLLVFGAASTTNAQGVLLSGTVKAKSDGTPIEYATVTLKECELWAITDNRGRFAIKNVPAGNVTLAVRCLGYATLTTKVNVKAGMQHMDIALNDDNLKLNEVEVVAKRKGDAATTSYTIDRLALDNRQALNLGDIMSLLPGGKTWNSSLLRDPRIALRSQSGEMGNASFGTAVEVDGVRLDNNATPGETLGADTRTVSTANIESIEVVTGVPSVEYGDLSNGVVKVNTRRGKSPFIVEAKLNQHTRQLALSKGVDLGRNGGLINFSLEHARSFGDITSPYTAYQRNVLSAHYLNVLMRQSMPLTLNFGLTGNIGGYNSKADPDRELDSYERQRDNRFTANLSAEWLLNRKWLTSIALKSSMSYTDQLYEDYSQTSSATTLPYIHSMEEGYFVAYDYATHPTSNIILGPTGYWYVRSYNDSRPLSYAVKLKADWVKHFARIYNKVIIGADYTGSRNLGRGTYYEEARLTPTWRPYLYRDLPTLNNLALYAEERLNLPTGKLSNMEITLGVRNDISHIAGSAYGTASTLAPRANLRYVFWHGKKALVRSLSAHAGWGKSVKLPSFQVLYPHTSYMDRLAFTPGSTADNKAYYAYHTFPSQAVYNPDLKWQYTNQTDLGFQMNIGGTQVNVSAYYHKTFNPYTAVAVYKPYTYKYTSQAALERFPIPSANREYHIDQQTGIVTVNDVTGEHAPITLPYTEREGYLINRKYVNGSPTERFGIEWIVDFAQIKALRTSLRLDGNYYYYKGLDNLLFAALTSDYGKPNAQGKPYTYIGHYRGSGTTSTANTASPSVSNGSISREANLNVTLSTHIPRIRMIMSLRVECSLYQYDRPLSELPNGTRGYALEKGDDFFGTPFTSDVRDKHVVVYPEYYSTWDAPDKLIPFAEKFAWAKDNDPQLFNDLAKMVKRTNYAFVMNPDRVSAYYSANFSVTKEIGDRVQVMFYANNFWNTMRRVRSTRTGQETSLYGSSYVPNFYYGLGLKVKI